MTDVRLQIVPEEEAHPHDHLRAYHEAGAGTLVMPNGSLVSVSHREEVTELQLSLTMAVYRAWEAHSLRTWQGRPHEGNYCCPRCHCRKNGTDDPNNYDEPCEDHGCLCHEGIDEL